MKTAKIGSDGQEVVLLVIQQVLKAHEEGEQKIADEPLRGLCELAEDLLRMTDDTITFSSVYSYMALQAVALLIETVVKEGPE